MSNNTPIKYHYHQGQKCNTTKVEISDADNTYIVILNKRNCNAAKKPDLNFLNNMKLSQNQENKQCWAIDNIRIIVSKRKKTKQKKIKKPKHRTHFITIDEYLKIMAKKCSTPDIHIDVYNRRRITKRQRSDTFLNTSTSFRTQCIINTVTLYPKRVPAECVPLLRHPLLQAQLRIYRYHFNEKEETYRCSSNSMSNLIQSLYDCHREKRFDHFDFFQCGHLQLEERIFGEVRELPEGVVRETKDSIHINTFSAGKVFEEREEEIGLTNLSLLLPDEAILQNVYNISPVNPPKSYARIQHELNLQEIYKMILNHPRQIRSENLHTSKATTYQIPLLGKSLIERKNVFGVYSLNGFVALGRENKIISVTQKVINLSQEPNELESNERYTEAKSEVTEVFAIKEETVPPKKDLIPLSSGENARQPKIGNKECKTNIVQKLAKEEKIKITTKRVSSEILLRRRDAGFLISLDQNMLESKNNMPRCNAKHSISLQDVKTTSERKMLKRVRKDFVLCKELKNIIGQNGPNKSMKLDDTVRPNTVPLDKNDNDTSLVALDSPIAKTKKVVKQTDEMTVESKCQSENNCKDNPGSSMMPLKEHLLKQKEHKRRGIPVLVDRILPRKKTADKVLKTSIGLIPPSDTKKGKTTPLKTPIPTATLHVKSGSDNRQILKPLAEQTTPLLEERAASDNGVIDNADAEDIILASNIENEKLAGEIPVFDDALDNSVCSIYTSQVKRIERTKSKSHLEKDALSKTQGTHTLLEQTSSVSLKDDTSIYKPLPEAKTCWDKVLIKKIEDELALVKKTDTNFRKVRGTSLNKRNLNEKNTTLKDRLHHGVTSHGFSFPDSNTASKVKKDLDLPPVPKSLAEKERHAKAQYLKQFTPLEGKTDLEKEKILRALVGKGKPLPEGRTKAEKALIDKVRAKTVLQGHTYFTTATERKNKIAHR